MPLFTYRSKWSDQPPIRSKRGLRCEEVNPAAQSRIRKELVAAHEALRDLVRAREDARQDQHRARQRLSKFLRRHGQRPPDGVKKSWTQKYMTWIKEQVHFDQPALEATLLDYTHEVEHMAERIQRLEKAIDEAIEQAPPEMCAVVEALQALRGVAKVTAGTIVAELGSLSRFAKPRQLMGYSGLVSSEFTTGHRIQRGNQRHRLEGTVAPAQAFRPDSPDLFNRFPLLRRDLTGGCSRSAGDGTRGILRRLITLIRGSKTHSHDPSGAASD